MKKYLFLLCSFLLCACTTEYSYTFHIGNENIILNTPYSLKETNDGVIIEGDNFSIEGIFVTNETFETYYDSLMIDEKVKIIKKTNDSIYWKTNNETNCIIRISDSTSMLFGSLDDVVDEYKNITFEIQ